MANGNLLFQEDNNKDDVNTTPIYAVTLALFEDGNVEISPETIMDDIEFFYDPNITYRIICDLKNQLEIIRALECKEEFGKYLSERNYDEEDDEREDWEQE